MTQPSTLLALIVGDACLRRKKINAFLDRLIPKEDRSLRFQRMDLKDVGVNRLLAQARSFPMMGGNQIFLLQDALDLKQSEMAFFERYFENPFPSSYFILEAETIRNGHPLLKMMSRLGSRAARIDCALPDRMRGLDFVRERLKTENRRMTKEVWSCLQEKTAGNLTLLDGCLDKLILYTAEGALIDAAAVERLSDQFFIYDVWQLAAAVAEKNAQKAITIFRFLYESEGSVVGLVGILNWQLKRLWQAKKIMAAGGGEGTVLRKLRMSPYRLKPFLRQAGRFQENELEEAIQKLSNLDRQFKTGACREQIALEALLTQLASGPTRSDRQTIGLTPDRTVV